MGSSWRCSPSSRLQVQEAISWPISLNLSAMENGLGAFLSGPSAKLVSLAFAALILIMCKLPSGTRKIRTLKNKNVAVEGE